MKYIDIVEKLHKDHPEYKTFVFDYCRSLIDDNLKHNKCIIQGMNFNIGEYEKTDFSEKHVWSPFALRKRESLDDAVELFICEVPEDFNSFIVNNNFNEKLTVVRY